MAVTLRGSSSSDCDLFEMMSAEKCPALSSIKEVEVESNKEMFPFKLKDSPANKIYVDMIQIR